ncbi:hypothetical protein SLS62_002997 [Diatrype stigma]|uniref:NAD(P)-binding domain-containing protein n=1 Tax=Diatrype stigma TaxID=117547 RepID=A0AAN9V7F2_9PEZI
MRLQSTTLRLVNAMSPIDNPVIPKGSTVLITGVNGFIASHIADQFLAFGYKVRGTTRDAKKNAWTQNLFDSKYKPGNFELVTVVDLAADGAYDEIIKGVVNTSVRSPGRSP